MFFSKKSNKSLLDVIMNRKSVRVFSSKPISSEDKLAILNAAAAAPTAGCQQLYTIIDVTDQKVKEALVQTCDHQQFIAEAQMVLIFCADCLKWYKGFSEAACNPRKPGLGDLMLAVSDANIAAENAVIAAESLGICSCYIGDVMENCEVQRTLLNLPSYVFPAAMLVFGYPTAQLEKQQKPQRAPLDAIVHENAYPEMNEELIKKLFEYKAGDQEYSEWMQAFCDRKYNSDFSKEMTRSVDEYAKPFSNRRLPVDNIF